MEPYLYKRLERKDSVRLLSVQPGFREDALQGTLSTLSLKDNIEFSALSYVWGSDEKCEQLATPEGTIPITASLNLALRRLRSLDSQLVIWVDAVCINQSDNEEKAHQVRAMGDIYRQATTVHVYLGEEADDSHLVEGVFKTLSTVDFRAVLGLGPSEALDNSHFATLLDDPLPKEGDPAWGAVRAFWRRPWFRRSWIVQECVLAKEPIFYCGAWSLTWDELAGAVAQGRDLNLSITYIGRSDTHEQGQQGQNGERAMFFLIWLRGNGYQAPSRKLLDLLGAFRHTLATRARDRLFSLLGLAHDVQISAFDPNYDEPLESVVSRYCRALVAGGHGRDLFATAGLSSQPHRFPSWAPDWIGGMGEAGRICDESIDRKIFRASRDTALVMELGQKHSDIEMRGIHFDTIKTAGQSYSEHPHARNIENPLQPAVDRLEAADKVVASMLDYPRGEDISSAYWKTLISDRQAASARASGDFYKAHPIAREILRKRYRGQQVGPGDARRGKNCGVAVFDSNAKDL